MSFVKDFSRFFFTRSDTNTAEIGTGAADDDGWMKKSGRLRRRGARPSWRLSPPSCRRLFAGVAWLRFEIGDLPRRGFGKMPNTTAKMAALPKELPKENEPFRKIAPSAGTPVLHLHDTYIVSAFSGGLKIA